MCHVLCRLGSLELCQRTGLQEAWGSIGWLGFGDGVSMIIPNEEERGSLRHWVGELTDVLVLWR